MDILVYIVIGIIALISLYLLIEGISKDMPICYGVGGVALVVSIITAVSYFFGWYMPMILFFGIFGAIITLMGVSGEQESETFKIGIIFCGIGLIFCFISFYYWYISGWYMSMAIVTCALSYRCVKNVLKGRKEYFPIFSASLLLMFVGITIYISVVHEVNIILILLLGVFVEIISHYIWTIVYDKVFWTTIKGVMKVMTPFFNYHKLHRK